MSGMVAAGFPDDTGEMLRRSPITDAMLQHVRPDAEAHDGCCMRREARANSKPVAESEKDSGGDGGGGYSASKAVNGASAGPRRFGPPTDPFELGERVGKGGQATVHLCRRLCFPDNTYAAKVISMRFPSSSRKERVERDRRLKNLRREVNIMQEMYHPNVLNLHGAYYEPAEDPLECILVMDLCPGGELHAKVAEEYAEAGRLGQVFKGLGGVEIATKYIARQLLSALEYMHANKVVHRDLKLENVLIVRSFHTEVSPPDLPVSEKLPDQFHDVKIADMGLSRRLGSERNLERSLTPVGTPGFFAPEVLEMEYDERADFWSFGVMTYLMLAACYPFELRFDQIAPQRYKEAVKEIKDCDSWALASDEAKEFVQGLLTIDPVVRLTLDGCLRHAWLEVPTPSSQESNTFKRAVSEDWETSREDGFGIQRTVGVVEEVRGRTGYAVDSIALKLRDGVKSVWGGKGGVAETRFALEPDELIIAAMQESRHDFLGNSIVLYTSTGRVLPILGTEAKRRNRLVAEDDCQIVGLQFQGHVLSGIKVMDAPESGQLGRVRQISGRVGHAVDQVSIELRNGKTRTYGGNGGTDVGPFYLEETEYIIVVEQISRDAFLGNSIVFYTSLGNIIQVAGMQATRSFHFVAPAGRQICGFEFEGNQLLRVNTCPKNGDLDDREFNQVIRTRTVTHD